MDRPLSVAALRWRTPDRTAGGARGAKSLALAPRARPAALAASIVWAPAR